MMADCFILCCLYSKVNMMGSKRGIRQRFNDASVILE
jgi:hypothetical protein